MLLRVNLSKLVPNSEETQSKGNILQRMTEAFDKTVTPHIPHCGADLLLYLCQCYSRSKLSGAYSQKNDM